MNLSAKQKGAEYRDQRDCNDRCSDHRKGFCESEWVKELSFLTDKCKHGNKSEDDDRHREKDRSADELR
jgi:hypothetical protein